MTAAVATAPMTPAQGRYLTSLLNDLTAVAPAAGAEARTRLHAMHAAGTLDKRETSRAIDVLKAAIRVATAPTAPAQRTSPVARRAQEATLRGQAYTEVVYLQDGTLQEAVSSTVARTAPVAPVGALVREDEVRMLAARREAAASLNLTPGRRPARGRSVAPKGPNKIIESLRTWTPERSAALLASGEVVPF